MKTIKLFDGSRIEYKEIEENKFLVSHKNDEITLDEVKSESSVLDTDIQYYAALSLFDLLDEEFTDVKLVETSILIETSTHQVWIEPIFDGKKLGYYLGTVALAKLNDPECEDTDLKNNCKKGSLRTIKNYINCFI